MTSAAEKEARKMGKGSDRLKCKPGEIMRVAHYRRTRSGEKTLVPASCIKDPLKGKRKPGELGPGRKPKGLVDANGNKVTIKVTEGRLSKHGYSVDDPEKERRAALKRVIKHEKSLKERQDEYGNYRWQSLYKRLILLSTWNKRKNKARAARARKDAEFVKSLFA